MDAISLLENLSNGSTTPEKLVTESLNRLEKENPALNAATEILTEEAKEQIRNLPEGPLKGLPISIKECYALKGKTITSGSKRMPPIVCREDAAVVKKLKDAGAVIIARGNTSEFLLGRETNNLLYGTTNSTINPGLTVGGSSGGDGSMAASGIVAFGIGTDIGGSCRYPAVFNGIVGFKPASGQIDKKGIFPAAGNDFSETMNSPGVLCRSVRDVRLVYNVIADKKLNHSETISDAQIFTSKDFQVKIKDESISNALKASVDFFSAKFPVRDLAISESGKLYLHFNALMFAGFTDKIYEWSVTKDGKKLSYFGEFFRRLRGKNTISDELFALLFPFNVLKPSAAKLEKVIEEVKELRAKYSSLLGNKGVLILPTLGILAPQHKKFIPQYNKPGIVEIITPVSFCNVLNLSCITIPAGKYRENKNINPPGIQLVCAPGNEELLLNVAEQLEAGLN
jgi:Asp-tRNA(Asn)/Glu-tRNA(Gln) amidotransferase A subunit family amidase